MQRLSPRTGSGVPQPAASAEGRIVVEEDWQRCRMILEARKAEEQSPPMQEHIADLSDVLQKLNKPQRPNQSELRQMAKSLSLPQRNIDLHTLLQNIQQAFPVSYTHLTLPTICSV